VFTQDSSDHTGPAMSNEGELQNTNASSSFAGTYDNVAGAEQMRAIHKAVQFYLSQMDQSLESESSV